MDSGGDGVREGLTRREALARTAGAAAAMTAVGALGGAAPAVGAGRGAPYALGFTSLTDEVRLPHVPIEGRLPSWLGGTLLRNGPAKFEVGDEPFNHWFDGLAMLHAFRFTGGKVGYANRFLRSSAYEAWKTEGRIKYSEFATDPCRSVFSGVASIPIIAPLPNANVSLERLAGTFVATPRSPSRSASTPRRWTPSACSSRCRAPAFSARRTRTSTARRGSGSPTRSTSSRPPPATA